MTDLRERIGGAMLGAVVGDALGFPVDQQDRRLLRDDPVTDMREGGAPRQPAGTWSDNMSLAFCLAESLVSGFNLQDQASRFCQWYLEGKWTPYGETLEVREALSSVIEKIAAGVPLSRAASDDAGQHDNGSLIRTLPVALWGHNLPLADLVEKVHASSAITHSHPRAMVACGLYAVYAVLLTRGQTPAEALASLRGNLPGIYTEKSRPFPRQMHHFERLLAPDFDKLPEPQIQSDDAAHSLEAGIWCLLQGQGFEEIVLRAANLGGDAATTAAIAGGLAGACLGEPAVPKRWIRRLARADKIAALVRTFTAACAPA